MIYKAEKIIFKKQIKKIIKKSKGTFIDLTFGNGFHSKLLLKNNKGITISFEIDKNNIPIKKTKTNNFYLHNRCFTKLKGIKINKINLIIIDIGYTVNQTKNIYSFKKNNLLDNLISDNKKSIINIINFGEKKEIIRILEKFENKVNSKLIAKEIIKKRKKNLIIKSEQLKKIVLKSIKKKKIKKKRNIFTKIFSSIKNFGNKTKKKLIKILDYIEIILKKNGLICIIYFNSFESKIIKKFFNKKKNFELTKKYTKKNSILKVYKKK